MSLSIKGSVATKTCKPTIEDKGWSYMPGCLPVEQGEWAIWLGIALFPRLVIDFTSSDTIYNL